MPAEAVMGDSKSPFPGMDPYIEASGLWEDFHHNLISEIQASLAQVIPERYVVRTGERSYITLAESMGEREHSFLPDIGIKSIAGTDGTTREDGGIAVAEVPAETAPVTMRAYVEDEYRESFVEIREASETQHLVTCIEVLSPSNKRPGSPGWELYQRMRQGLLLGTAHLVEIDLVRSGRRMPMVDPWPSSPFTLLVARNVVAPNCRVWPAHFRLPLPPIPVPLRKPDPDVSLNLQPMIDAIYARSRYARSIDYAKPIVPPLLPEDAEWLRRLLAEIGSGPAG